MPYMEMLDNKGQRTGKKRFHSDNQASKILRMKRPLWILCEQEKPKSPDQRPDKYKTIPEKIELKSEKTKELIDAVRKPELWNKNVTNKKQ